MASAKYMKIVFHDYSETSLSGHSVRRPPLYRGHLCKSPMLLFPYIFTSVKRLPYYKGQFCMALCDRYKEVSLYLSKFTGGLAAALSARRVVVVLLSGVTLVALLLIRYRGI